MLTVARPDRLDGLLIRTGPLAAPLKFAKSVIGSSEHPKPALSSAAGSCGGAARAGCGGGAN